MMNEETIKNEYVKMIKSIQNDSSSWKLGYAAALELVLQLKEDDWKELIKQ